jgi:hypothetical protein
LKQGGDKLKKSVVLLFTIALILGKPATVLLMASGLIGLAGFGMRKFRKR